ncbi:MAG: ABC transporter permease, partial [Roseovarius gahaiensis]
MTILILYVVIFAAAFFLVRFGVRKFRQMQDFTSLKTVTFGDESAVKPDRWASVISIVAIFLLWGAFTGSQWVPIHAPGPFVGDTQFTYTLEAPDGRRDDATVYARVFKVGADAEEPEIQPGDGFAKNDAIKVGAWRSELLLMDKNDEVKRKEGAKVVAIDGQPVAPGETVRVADGSVAVTAKGSLNFSPA